MGYRQRLWAKKARKALMAALGGCCVKCGSKRKLTFDCIVPQGDKHHRLNAEQRMSFYRRQHSAGNVQILCKSHNELKALTEDKAYYDHKPF